MNISEKYLKTSFEDLMKEHIDKIYKALGLLNSMVLCGENHTALNQPANKCDTCPSREFYESNTGRIMDAEVKPVSDELLTPPRTGERGELYEILWKSVSGGNGEECRIPCEEIENIITDVLKLYELKDPKASDEDIINASQDYVIDIRAILPTETAKAYQAGAMDMRDNNIHQITKR
jgi:hypothetical protein